MPRAWRSAYLTAIAAVVIPALPLTDGLLFDLPFLLPFTAAASTALLLALKFTPRRVPVRDRRTAAIGAAAVLAVSLSGLLITGIPRDYERRRLAGELVAIFAGLLVTYGYLSGRLQSPSRLRWLAPTIAACLLGAVVGRHVESFGDRWNYEHGREVSPNRITDSITIGIAFACLVPLCADVRNALRPRQAKDDRRWNFLVAVLLSLALLTLTTYTFARIYDHFYPRPPQMLSGLGPMIFQAYAFTAGLGLTCGACLIQLVRNRWNVPLTAATIVAQLACWIYWNLRMELH